MHPQDLRTTQELLPRSSPEHATTTQDLLNKRRLPQLVAAAHLTTKQMLLDIIFWAKRLEKALLERLNWERTYSQVKR